jgi:hypothetical protein
MKSPHSEAECKVEVPAADVDRRAFVSQYGKLALIAPPVVTALLSTAMSSRAIAQSAGSRGGSNAELLLVGGAGAAPLIATAETKAQPAIVQQAAPVAAPPAPVVVPPAPPPPAPGPERG